MAQSGQRACGQFAQKPVNRSTADILSGRCRRDKCGAVVEAYDTDAYGNTLVFTAPDTTGNWWGDAAVQSNYGANEIIYCGYRYDAETQNYYVRNRYYSPVLGRWITRDLIGYRGGINLYGYVGSSPTQVLDATGKFTIGDLNFILAQLNQELLKATETGRGVAQIKELISAIQALRGNKAAQNEIGDDVLDKALDEAKDIVSGVGGDVVGAEFQATLGEMELGVKIVAAVYDPAVRSAACTDCAEADCAKPHPFMTRFRSGDRALAWRGWLYLPIRYEIDCMLGRDGHIYVLMYTEKPAGFNWVRCNF